MGDSSLSPLRLRRDGERRARPGDHRPAAWHAGRQANLHRLSRPIPVSPGWNRSDTVSMP